MSSDGVRLALDTARLEAYLSSAVPDFSGPIAARQFSGGQSNPTYRLETPAASYVLRRKPPGVLLPSAHAIDREYRVMAALGAQGFPVPPVLHYCDDAGVIGAAFYLMRFVEGRVLFDTRLPGMAPSERTAVYDALIDTLAALHRVKVADAGLSDYGRPGGYIARQVARWSTQYRATAGPEAPEGAGPVLPEMARLMAWLPGAVAGVPDETCLVHGDYRLDNAMLAPEGPDVVAVLDWELSTLGHPLADLSYFLMTWAFPADLRWGLAEADLAALGIPDLAAMAARYAAATGREGVPDLDLLIAYNAFRLAAILQGVYARGLAGNAADEAALGMGADVPRLARIALDFAERAGA
ncbi:MAG: phosphotransferase family protein [Pseudomonadota bacterium]